MSKAKLFISVLGGSSWKNGRSLCGRCLGKRFDPQHNGGQRKCQRCRGMGFTTVGGTKR